MNKKTVSIIRRFALKFRDRLKTDVPLRDRTDQLSISVVKRWYMGLPHSERYSAKDSMLRSIAAGKVTS